MDRAERRRIAKTMAKKVTVQPNAKPQWGFGLIITNRQIVLTLGYVVHTWRWDWLFEKVAVWR